jgi:transposase-like protein
MARRVYTEKDQARVAVVLQANDGNIKRTARETGVPINTVRDWKTKWANEGYPEPVEDAIPAATEELLTDLKEAVKLATGIVIEKLRDGKVDAKTAAWISGVYIDKIRLYEGQATQRTETVHALPSADEAKALMRGVLAEIVEAAETRQADIIDAGVVEGEFEVIEPPALPPASDTKE